MPRTATKSTSRKRAAKSTKPRSNSRQRDVIALIKADHATVNQLFRRYKSLGERAEKSRRQVAERVIKELSVHAAVEEQVLYPNAREALARGKSLVKEAIKEHQELKELLATLDKASPASDGFDELMSEIIDSVRHHVKEEEQPGGILSELRKHASRDELMQMATLCRAAKKAAPTRPHPMAPNTPPGNLVVGAVAGLMDKARDAVSRR